MSSARAAAAPRAPHGIPVDRVVGVLEEVRARLAREAVHGPADGRARAGRATAPYPAAVLTGVLGTLGRNATILGVVAIGATVATVRPAPGRRRPRPGLRRQRRGPGRVWPASSVEATDQLGHRFGPGATGVLQSALGNLPELFISIFSLQAGLVVVVQTALIGSILANTLLVLGLAFFARRPAPRRRSASAPDRPVDGGPARPGGRRAGHPDPGDGARRAGRRARPGPSVFAVVVLLVVFAASVPFSIRGGPGASAIEAPVEDRVWPLRSRSGVLAAAAVGAALMSDWFVEALEPAMATLGIRRSSPGWSSSRSPATRSRTWSGSRWPSEQGRPGDQPDPELEPPGRDRADPGARPHQPGHGRRPLTLVLSPAPARLAGAGGLLAALIVFDGESTWLEGLALVALYLIIAASVWYGRALPG